MTNRHPGGKPSQIMHSIFSKGYGNIEVAVQTLQKVGNSMDITPELESKILFSINRLKQLRNEGSLTEVSYKLHLWKYLSRLQQQINEEAFERLLKEALDMG